MEAQKDVLDISLEIGPSNLSSFLGSYNPITFLAVNLNLILVLEIADLLITNQRRVLYLFAFNGKSHATLTLILSVLCAIRSAEGRLLGTKRPVYGLSSIMAATDMVSSTGSCVHRRSSDTHGSACKTPRPLELTGHRSTYE